MIEQTGDPCVNQQYEISKHDVSTSWRRNVICENLQLPLTTSRVLSDLPTNVSFTHCQWRSNGVGKVQGALEFQDKVTKRRRGKERLEWGRGPWRAVLAFLPRGPRVPSYATAHCTPNSQQIPLMMMSLVAWTTQSIHKGE